MSIENRVVKNESSEQAGKSNLKILTLAVTEEFDLVPPLYRAQMVNDHIQEAVRGIDVNYEISFGQGLKGLDHYDMPSDLDLILVNVMGMDKSARSTFKPLRKYLRTHKTTEYGIFTVKEHQSSIAWAGFKNIIAHSSADKPEFVWGLLKAKLPENLVKQREAQRELEDLFEKSVETLTITHLELMFRELASAVDTMNKTALADGVIAENNLISQEALIKAIANKLGSYGDGNGKKQISSYLDSNKET